MTDDQIAQYVNKYVRSLGRLLGKANAASGSDRLGLLYVASRRLAQLGQLAESQGFVPPVIAMELAINYGQQLEAVGYGEIVIGGPFDASNDRFARPGWLQRASRNGALTEATEDQQEFASSRGNGIGITVPTPFLRNQDRGAMPYKEFRAVFPCSEGLRSNTRGASPVYLSCQSSKN